MSELHIASCVGFCTPEALEGVVRAIRATGIAEVPRHDPGGRLVLLMEGPSSRHVLDAIDAVRALPGVLAVHLAYQHVESEPESQESR